VWGISSQPSFGVLMPYVCGNVCLGMIFYTLNVCMFRIYLYLEINSEQKVRITFPVVNDGLPARIRACGARLGLANCGGVRRGSL